MTPVRALGLAAAGGALAAGGLLYTPSGGPSSASAGAYDVSVAGTPRDIDEGDLVEFVATVTERDTSASGPDGFSFPALEWDFGDGSERLREADLTDVRHRFEDGGRYPSVRRVRVRVDDSEGTTTVRVRNVPPTIRAVGSSKPALAGDPVSFEASATDPGLRDRLTYTWDFGDGGTGRGQQVRHTYRQDGIYDVTLTVDDGDGGEDRETMSVIVGEGFQLTVGGAGTGHQKGWIYVRSRAPSAGPTSGLCHVDIIFEPQGEGLARLTALPSFGLSIAADGGLREGRYTVTGAHWSDAAAALPPVELREQRPDIFFAGVSTALSQPVEGAGALFSSFHFEALDGGVD